MKEREKREKRRKRERGTDHKANQKAFQNG